MATYRYFQSVPGCAVQRYGTASHIGAIRTPTGFKWSDEIVAVPTVECTRYIREYTQAVRAGELIEFSEQAARTIMVQHEDRRLAEQAAADEKRDAEAAAAAEAEAEAKAKADAEIAPRDIADDHHA